MIRFRKYQLVDVATRWKGTSYIKGQQARGIGIDCVNWLCVAFREGLGVDIPRRRLPAILGQAAPARAREAMRFLLKHVRPYEKLTHHDFRPWDVLVFASLAEGPEHVAISEGGRIVWHASFPGGITRTSLDAIDQPIYRSFRYSALWDSRN